jgi:BlaI family penicillinase repressor
VEEGVISLTQSEWTVMEALWERPKTLMELVRELGRSALWAKSTVTTMVRRMEGKGLLTYEMQGRAKLFSAAISREDVVAGETSSLLSRAYNGSVSLLMNTLTQHQQLTKAEIDELYAILQKAEDDAT